MPLAVPPMKHKVFSWRCAGIPTECWGFPSESVRCYAEDMTVTCPHLGRLILPRKIGLALSSGKS